MNVKQLIKHMQKFSTFEWLVFIKMLENKTEKELEKITKDRLQLFNLGNINWYVLIIDLALRTSKHENKNVKFNNLPNHNDYEKFIQLYVNSIDSISIVNDLTHSLHLTMSKLTYEQLKIYAPIYHGLGRLLKLYSSIEDKIKENFGLSPRQIVIFLMYNDSKHDIYQPFSFTVMHRNLEKIDSSITQKKLQKFLDTFSLTIKEYRIKARDMGITKKTIKSKRLILNYPIIRLEFNYYFIPSIYALEEGLSYKIFETLDSLQNKSQVFKTKFGTNFEDYIRDLTYISHKDYFHECDTFIMKKNEKKAEFYLLKEDTTIIIEAKLLHIDENIILHDSVQKLEWKFEKIIKKALIQIESCFEKVKSKNKYGIIVIHTHIPMLDSYLKSFKSTMNNKWIDNVILLSVVDYEVMIHNSFQKIVNFFQDEDRDSKQVALYFEQNNQYLLDSCNTVIDELIAINNKEV